MIYTISDFIIKQGSQNVMIDINLHSDQLDRLKALSEREDEYPNPKLLQLKDILIRKNTNSKIKGDVFKGIKHDLSPIDKSVVKN